MLIALNCVTNGLKATASVKFFIQSENATFSPNLNETVLPKSVYLAWMDKRYPQNYLIKRPIPGSVFLGIYCFLFLIIYRPFDLNPGIKLDFESTMALYVITMIFPHLCLVYSLRVFPQFAFGKQWTIGKELAAILLVLTGLSVFIFGVGFLVEGSGNRLNFATFLGSCKIVFLTCFILYAFLSVINFRGLESEDSQITTTSDAENITIQIKSKLKGQTLIFQASELIFAESDGNYVIFHLSGDNTIRKEMIRNSISDVEQMLSGIPFVIRTHRAFIVNMKKISQRDGNSSGYRLQLEGAAYDIPVSRSNVERFDRLYSKYS